MYTRHLIALARFAHADVLYARAVAQQEVQESATPAVQPPQPSVLHEVRV